MKQFSLKLSIFYLKVFYSFRILCLLVALIEKRNEMIFKKVEMTMLSFPFLLAMTPGGTCFSAVANKNVCSDKVLKSCDKSFVVKSNDN